MRVLVTGAGGNLGRAALPALAEAGHAVRALDFRPIETEHELVVADIRDPRAVTEAAAGCDAVVHAAALHGIHLRAWSAQDFWAINAHGSFNVLEAAREHGIARLVLASTMGVYGRSLEPPADAWAWVHEGLPALPQDVYGMTKLVAEQLARVLQPRPRRHHGGAAARHVRARRLRALRLPAAVRRRGRA